MMEDVAKTDRKTCFILQVVDTFPKILNAMRRDDWRPNPNMPTAPWRIHSPNSSSTIYLIPSNRVYLKLICLWLYESYFVTSGWPHLGEPCLPDAQTPFQPSGLSPRLDLSMEFCDCFLQGHPDCIRRHHTDIHIYIYVSMMLTKLILKKKRHLNNNNSRDTHDNNNRNSCYYILTRFMSVLAPRAAGQAPPMVRVPCTLSLALQPRSSCEEIKSDEKI